MSHVSVQTGVSYLLPFFFLNVDGWSRELIRSHSRKDYYESQNVENQSCDSDDFRWRFSNLPVKEIQGTEYETETQRKKHKSARQFVLQRLLVTTGSRPSFYSLWIILQKVNRAYSNYYRVCC